MVSPWIYLNQNARVLGQFKEVLDFVGEALYKFPQGVDQTNPLDSTERGRKNTGESPQPVSSGLGICTPTHLAAYEVKNKKSWDVAIILTVLCKEANIILAGGCQCCLGASQVERVVVMAVNKGISLHTHEGEKQCSLGRPGDTRVELS